MKENDGEVPGKGDRMRETSRSLVAFEDYFNLGPGRSLAKLRNFYLKYTKKTPPTRWLRTLKKWSTNHDWQNRVAQRNEEIASATLEKLKARATETGYAIFQKRIHDLNIVGELLLNELLEEDRRWVRDVKQIGSGEDAERVDIVRFNAALVEQFRKTLNDIASEMGERRPTGLFELPFIPGIEGSMVQIREVIFRMPERKGDGSEIIEGRALSIDDES